MFIVVTRTYYTEAAKQRFLELARKSDPVMCRQKGFVGKRSFIAHSDNHMVSFIEWESRADHEACMASPDWAVLNQEWGAMLQNEEIRFELETYDPWSADQARLPETNR